MDEKRISTSWEDCILSLIETISRPPQKPIDLLSTLYTTYFPSDDKDIFTKLHEECKDFFKPGIIEKELKNNSNIIGKIKQNLKNYCEVKREKRGDYMNILVESCETFYKRMTTNKEVTQFVGVMITFAFFHLAILSERNTHQLEIYEGWGNKYKKQLLEKISAYKAYFIDIYPKWQDWRKDQITVKIVPDSKKKENIIGEVLDTLTTASFVKYSSSRETQIKLRGVCEKAKIRFYNDINAKFMNLYVHTFALNKFYPDKHEEPPKAPNSKVATVWYGTYGRDTFPDGEHDIKDYEEYELSNDLPGVITGINIQEYNVLDALTFLYKNRPGELVGNPQGGHLTTIRGLNEEYNHIIAVDLYFCHRVMCAIQFFFPGGATEVLGNRSNADAVRISCGSIGKRGDFKLTGVKMASSTADLPGKELSVG
ncbi:15562_t:CDS:2, partial [Acaulospora colombiana]